MKRRDVSLTIAFCASLAVHAALVGVAAREYVAAFAAISLPGFARDSAAYAPPSIQSDQRKDTALGESDGTGEAIVSVAGEAAHQAQRGGQDQPLLSLDPVGPGTVGDPPSLSTLLPAADSTTDHESAADEAFARGPVFGLAAVAEDLPSDRAAPAIAPAMRIGRSESLGPLPDDLPENELAVASPPPPDDLRENDLAVASPLPRLTPPTAQAAQTTPRSPHRPADPAPQAESESDPFAVAGTIRFARGRTDVQMGRRHRIVRPRLELAGLAAATRLPAPLFIVLELHLDETGNVTRVDIKRSSGSADIDQPVKVAAYRWWLEPSKDKNGKPVADVVPFVIRFE